MSRNTGTKTKKCLVFQFYRIDSCLIREKVVTFRMVKLNMLLSIFLITK